MPNKTLEAWQNGAEAVSQGRYETGSITCISDIVRKEDDAYVLIEIKSSSSAKKEHALDLAEIIHKPVKPRVPNGFQNSALYLQRARPRL